jgi:hypothetical protein
MQSIRQSEKFSGTLEWLTDRISPMKEFGKLLGFALIVIGIYWLGKNIILTTQSAYYGWQTIPAAGSVVLMLAGLHSPG